MEEQEKDNKVLPEQKKECEAQEHYFNKIPNSAMMPLMDEKTGEWYGEGFTTWECVYCKKKVKSS